MCVTMEGANEATVIVLTSLLPKGAVAKGGLEPTANVISDCQVFAEDVQHLEDDGKRVFRSDK